MSPASVWHDALVLVGDGEKALFFRNIGNVWTPTLEVERVLEPENSRTRDPVSDRSGRSVTGIGVPRRAMDETNWCQLGEERFTAEIANALYRLAHTHQFTELVVVAPPRVLGMLRNAFHKEVAERITAEVPKELTSHAVAEIEKVLAV